MNATLPRRAQVSTETDSARPADPGLDALVTLLHFQGVAADRGQIRHRLGTTKIGAAEMLRCAKDLGLKARAYRTDWSRLAKTPLPAIATLRDGGFLVVAKAAQDQVLVQAPQPSRPALMTRAELLAIWDGGLILMTRRAGLSDITRRFDITWFLGAVHKYRHLLSEVLVASFFLQLFALVSPLFFQVVIDKVLVHRALSTLDVLLIGLVAISIFETILGILRTYLFAHTTNRIDVELGARLFHHLLALPMAYFQARRVGDSVARVRELENIRTFLTSSALTLAIDLFFTFVFLAVMFFYSPLLTCIVLGSFPFYIAVSAGATPLFRRRLDEKFQRGAENQAFLVESVTGIETLKAMAVEPQMQRHWEEQIAGYVAASFRVLSLGNTASQVVQLVSKLVTAGLLYFGAKLVIEGSLSVGELVAFNILAGRVNAPVLRLAHRPSRPSRPRRPGWPRRTRWSRWPGRSDRRNGPRRPRRSRRSGRSRRPGWGEQSDRHQSRRRSWLPSGRERPRWHPAVNLRGSRYHGRGHGQPRRQRSVLGHVPAGRQRLQWGRQCLHGGRHSEYSDGHACHRPSHPCSRSTSTTASFTSSRSASTCSSAAEANRRDQLTVAKGPADHT